MQAARLNQNQGQELCDEIADMLLITIESKDIDDKVEAAVNVFLTRQKINSCASELARNISWSIKVKLEQP